MQEQPSEPRWQRRLAVRAQIQQPHLVLPQPEVEIIPEARSDSVEPAENEARYIRELGMAATLAIKKHPKPDQWAGEDLHSRSSQSCSLKLSIHSESTIFDFPLPPPSPNALHKFRLEPRTSAKVHFERKHLSTSTASSRGLVNRSRSRRSSSADGALPQLPPASWTNDRRAETEAAVESNSDTGSSRHFTPNRS